LQKLNLFECDFGWFALAVLIFLSPLDPRLGLVVLFLTFGLDFQDEMHNA
jgi:hypothetical protein